MSIVLSISLIVLLAPVKSLWENRLIPYIAPAKMSPVAFVEDDVCIFNVCIYIEGNPWRIRNIHNLLGHRRLQQVELIGKAFVWDHDGDARGRIHGIRWRSGELIKEVALDFGQRYFSWSFAAINKHDCRRRSLTDLKVRYGYASSKPRPVRRQNIFVCFSRRISHPARFICAVSKGVGLNLQLPDSISNSAIYTSGSGDYLVHLLGSRFVVASRHTELKNHEDKDRGGNDQFNMPVRSYAAELPKVRRPFSSSTFWYVPSLVLAWALFIFGTYGMLWMMGGIGLRWREYLAIGICVIGCFFTAIWFIPVAASMGQ